MQFRLMFFLYLIVFGAPAAAQYSTHTQAYKAPTTVSWENAMAAGRLGLAPKFKDVPQPELQRDMWDIFGLYLLEYEGKAFVAGLREDGAAIRQGIRVGEMVFVTSFDRAQPDLKPALKGFRQALKFSDFTDASRYPKPPQTILYVAKDTQTARREVYLTGAATVKGTPVKTASHPAVAQPTVNVSIPAALRADARHYPGLIAILEGTTDKAEPVSVAKDAMDTLLAISRHKTDCTGPRPVSIPVDVTRTTTTRSGTGIVRGTESTTSRSVLRVRFEFADWTQRNIRLFSDKGKVTVIRSVSNLILFEGCDGQGFLQLQAALAGYMNVTLPADAKPRANDAGYAGIPDTSDAFIASCYPLTLQSPEFRNRAHRGAASTCFCQEHAARKSGDTQLYEALGQGDMRYLDANPHLKETFNDTFAQCITAPKGTEFYSRQRALYKRLNI